MKVIHFWPQIVNGRRSQQGFASAWTIRRVRDGACAELSFPLYICLTSAAFEMGSRVSVYQSDCLSFILPRACVGRFTLKRVFLY